MFFGRVRADRSEPHRGLPLCARGSSFGMKRRRRIWQSLAVMCCQGWRRLLQGHREVTAITGGAADDSPSAIDFSQLRNFQYLKRLELLFDAHTLNPGFNSIFQLHRLERLVIKCLSGPMVLDFDMAEVARLTNLREIRIDSVFCRGDLSSLEALEKLKYLRLNFVMTKGNLLSLANLPSLSLVDLYCPVVEGDISDIDSHHFPSLKILKISSTRIYGRPGTKLMSADDASTFFTAWSRVLSHPRPMSTLEGGKLPWVELKKSSAEYYEPGRWTVFARHPPFTATMIRVGQRLGYRWKNKSGQTCDICWLDPEPSSDDADYDAYWAGLYQLEQKHLHSIFRGHSRPPTREEWQQIARA